MRLSSRPLLAVLATASLIGASPLPASAATAGPDGQATVQYVCQACNGYRYQIPGELAVYLVIDGVRHHVPDQETYLNLWPDFSGIQPGGGGITIGDPLVHGAYLARESGQNPVYLVGRSRRHVPNETVFYQYGFTWPKVRVVDPGTLPGPGPELPGS